MQVGLREEIQPIGGRNIGKDAVACTSVADAVGGDWRGAISGSGSTVNGEAASSGPHAQSLSRQHGHPSPWRGA